MNEHLIKYSITPRVLRADVLQTVSVIGLDDSCRFCDEVDYIVKITRKDEWAEYNPDAEYMLRGNNNTDVLTCRSKDGALRFEYLFEGEGEWTVNIARADISSHAPIDKVERFGWRWILDDMLKGFSFHLYSLKEDMYKKRPYKGDLHIHSNCSDGSESPAMVAAQYRKFGFDFISLTDHYSMDSSCKLIELYSEINTRLKLFPGEEVHPIIQGVFHMVNFNASTSVNKIAHENPEATAKQVADIAETLDIEDETIRTEVAWFKWITDEIRKAGGIAIFPHPYWLVDDSYVIRKPVVDELFRRGLLDAFEIFGGNPSMRNRMQAQLYYYQCDRGHKVPIVGSSDSHTCLAHGRNSQFDECWTIAFAGDVSGIPESITSGDAVAVDNYDVNSKNIIGNLRLVNYAWFLVENYYEIHDQLCNAAGQALLRYVLGDKSQNHLIDCLEKELEKFNASFFGENA